MATRSQLPYPLLLLFAACLALPGCVTSQLVSKEMEPQISRDVAFESLRAEPEKFKGRVMALGGKVLSAKRLKDTTQIEILQLPLDKADAPVLALPESKGRFFAYQEGFLDPATVPPGTFVSMIAEVTGSKTQPLDESTYSYPTVKIQTLKVWPESRYLPYYPYYPNYPYYPYFYPYPYRPYYPYWADPWY